MATVWFLRVVTLLLLLQYTASVQRSIYHNHSWCQQLPARWSNCTGINDCMQPTQIAEDKDMFGKDMFGYPRCEDGYDLYVKASKYDDFMYVHDHTSGCKDRRIIISYFDDNEKNQQVTTNRYKQEEEKDGVNLICSTNWPRTFVPCDDGENPVTSPCELVSGQAGCESFVLYHHTRARAHCERNYKELYLLSDHPSSGFFWAKLHRESISCFEVRERFISNKLICASGDPNKGKQCSDVNPINTYCKEYSADCVQLLLSNFEQLKCQDDAMTGYNIYFKNGNAKGFIKATKIQCANNVWEVTYKFGSAEYQESLLPFNNVICAKENPSKIVCQPVEVFPLPGQSDYFHFAQVVPGEMGTLIDCGADSEIISSDGVVGKQTAICNKDGIWDSEGILLTGDKIQCRRLKLCKTELETDCNSMNLGSAVACSSVILDDYAPLKCSSTSLNLYFQQEGQKWIKATEISCNNSDWKLKYKYGSKDIEKTLFDGDSVICGMENPDSEVCPPLEDFEFPEYVDYKFSTQVGSREIGKILDCGAGFEIFSPNGVIDKQIVCNDDGKWKTAGIPVTGKIICRRFKLCMDTELETDCSLLSLSTDVQCSAVPLDNRAPIKCPTSSPDLYFKSHIDKKWIKAVEIKCEKYYWKLNYKYGLTNKEETLVEGQNVICGKVNPSKEACPSLRDFDFTEHDDYKIFTPVVGREVGNILECGVGYEIFSQNGVLDKQTVCNDDGKWEMDGVPVTGKILCRRIKLCTEKTPLETDCQGIESDVSCAKVVFDNTAPLTCPDPYWHNLYVKLDSGKKWIKATEIQCELSVWNFKYKYGSSNKSEVIGTGGKVICGRNNPDKNACPVPKGRLNYEGAKNYERVYAMHPESTKDAQVGAQMECANGFELFSNLNEAGSSSAVCGTSGAWISDGVPLLGDNFECRRPPCRTCFAPPNEFVQPPRHIKVENNLNNLERKGECLTYNCKTYPKAKFIVRSRYNYKDIYNRRFGISVVDYRFSVGELRCEDGIWYDENEDAVQEASCVRDVSCHDVHTLANCSTESYQPFDDCEDIKEVNLYEEISCPTKSKKLLIRNRFEGYWDEVKSMKCDATTGKWKVVLMNNTEQQRDGTNSVVCSSETSRKRKGASNDDDSSWKIPCIVSLSLLLLIVFQCVVMYLMQRYCCKETFAKRSKKDQRKSGVTGRSSTDQDKVEGTTKEVTSRKANESTPTAASPLTSTAPTAPNDIVVVP